MPDTESTPLFDIVFTGRTAPGHDPDAVRASLQLLFRLDDARAQRLFRAGRVVVKRAVDLATAERFRAAFLETGALVEIEPADVEETIIATVAAEPPPSPWTAPGAGSGTGQTTGRGSVGWSGEPSSHPAATGADPGAGANLQLEPIGAPLDEIDDRVPIPAPDISYLAIEPGSDWSLEDCQLPVRPAALPPTDHLALEPIAPARADRDDRDRQ